MTDDIWNDDEPSKRRMAEEMMTEMRRRRAARGPITEDQQHRMIIEAAEHGRRLYNMEDSDAEFEPTRLAFETALAKLMSDESAAMMMVMKLLDGSPYSVTSGSANTIQLCIALAQKIGATVEGGASGPLADALTPLMLSEKMRSITIYPPSQVKQ